MLVSLLAEVEFFSSPSPNLFTQCCTTKKNRRPVCIRLSDLDLNLELNNNTHRKAVFQVFLKI